MATKNRPSLRKPKKEIPTEKLKLANDKVDKLLSCALSFDETNNYKDALEYYDRALKVISEALRIKFNVEVWPSSKKIRKRLKRLQGSCLERKNEILNPSQKKSHKKMPKNDDNKRNKRNYKQTTGTTQLTPTTTNRPGKNIFGHLKSLFVGDVDENIGNNNTKTTNTRRNETYDIKSIKKPQIKKIQPKPKQETKPLTKAEIKNNPHLKGIDQKFISKTLDELLDRNTKVTFDDIAGLSNAKQVLHESVILPSLRPDLFSGLRSAPKGVLLFGPPGNGKTLLAKAVSNESNCKFFAISASSLVSKFLGESEKMVRALFGCARFLAPSIIFIDEIDAILSSRSSDEHEASRRLKTEFLVQMDGVATDSSARVLVLGATNLPFALDDAILRRILIPLPDAKGRKVLIQKILKKHEHKYNLDGKELDEIARATPNFSGSDIAALCREASMISLRELGSNILHIDKNSVRATNKKDFLKAIRRIKPSCDKALIAKINNWNNNFGSF